MRFTDVCRAAAREIISENGMATEKLCRLTGIIVKHMTPWYGDDAIKEKIRKLFEERVRGKPLLTQQQMHRHNGAEGHRLEKLMGLQPNCRNAPDLYGFEMKKHTHGKTTLGDWGPSYRIFDDDSLEHPITKHDFFHIFGRPNWKKHGRLSYTRPRINGLVDGKTMTAEHAAEGTDIVVTYNYNKDIREHKDDLVPKWIQNSGDIVLERWKHDKLSSHINKKFGQRGWFQCVVEDGIYTDIVFYQPFDFSCFLENFKKGVIYQDGVPYKSNSRWYSTWRLANTNISRLIQ